MNLEDLEQFKKSDLLDHVMAEFHNMLRDPAYVFDINTFHSKGDDGLIHCCFSGCILRMIYGPDFEHPVGALDAPYIPLMTWLERVRRGQVRDCFPQVLNLIYRKTFKTETIEIEQTPEGILAGVSEIRELIARQGY